MSPRLDRDGRTDPGPVSHRSLVERFAALDTATTHEASGRRGAVDPAIKPVWPAPRTVGRAFTAACHPGDNLAIHRAVALAGEGDILVVDAGGHLGGYWGEILTVAALSRGIAALVLDGGCRDLEGIERRRFPVWARGVYVAGCEKQAPGTVTQPIVCGGVAVSQGDIVVADRDGVVIVTAESAEATLAAAERRAAHEQETIERVRAGELTLDLLGLRPSLDARQIDDEATR